MGDMADYYREQGEWAELLEFEQQDPTEEEYAELNRRRNMSPRIKNKIKKTTSKAKKPVLIKVGNHFISPADIRCISSVKKGKLFIIKFYSEPNPEYPCFVEPQDIQAVLDQFDIVVSD